MNSAERHCYLCGVVVDEKSKTRDHVPPKGLFLKPLPSNLITVPCCEGCNNGKSNEEEFFRLIATIGLNKSAEADALYRQRVLPRTLERGRLRREINSMMKTAENFWSVVNGVYMPLCKVGVDLNILKRVIERTARGLTVYKRPALQVHNIEFETIIPKRGMLLEVLAEIGQYTEEIRIGGTSFHAFHGVACDAPDSGVWIMNFHQCIPAVVFYGRSKKHGGESLV